MILNMMSKMNMHYDNSIIETIISSNSFDIDTVYYDGKNILLRIIDNITRYRTFDDENIVTVKCLNILLQKYPQCHFTRYR